MIPTYVVFIRNTWHTGSDTQSAAPHPLPLHEEDQVEPPDHKLYRGRDVDLSEHCCLQSLASACI